MGGEGGKGEGRIGGVLNSPFSVIMGTLSLSSTVHIAARVAIYICVVLVVICSV